MDFVAKLYCYTQTCFCWRSRQISKPNIGQVTILLDSEHRNSNIPEELVENILVRLPLKDIFRFKVVCKSWLKLISCPYFKSNYVKNSPFTLISRAQYKYRNPNSKKMRLCFSLLEFARGKGGGEHTHNIPLLTPKLPDRTNSSFMSLIGGGASCDGSVFILHTKRFNPPPFFSKRRTTLQRVYLFNPVSGSCVKIVPDDIYRDGEGEAWAYKFGFIPSNSTYKLVRFDLNRAEIFTVGLDENWRKLGDFGSFQNFGVICFNGAHHWFSDGGTDKINTFDLLEEKSTSGIPLPGGYVSTQQSRCWLTILNDRLSVAERSAADTMVIWTMREYGVAASWSRLIVLTLGGPADIESRRRRDFGLVPTAVLANGDILFADRIRDGGGMWFYNLQHKRLTQVFDITPDSYTVGDYEFTYVPTFHS